MTDTIPPTPEVPPGLREAAQLTKLIPFVGAGASKLAGCPDWNEFADEALRVFVEHRKFSHAQLDQVKTLSPRVKLSIALALQAEHHTGRRPARSSRLFREGVPDSQRQRGRVRVRHV
jgi:hypothetical protein